MTANKCPYCDSGINKKTALWDRPRFECGTCIDGKNRVKRCYEIQIANLEQQIKEKGIYGYSQQTVDVITKERDGYIVCIAELKQTVEQQNVDLTEYEIDAKNMNDDNVRLLEVVDKYKKILEYANRQNWRISYFIHDKERGSRMWEVKLIAGNTLVGHGGSLFNALEDAYWEHTRQPAEQAPPDSEQSKQINALTGHPMSDESIAEINKCFEGYNISKQKGGE